MPRRCDRPLLQAITAWSFLNHRDSDLTAAHFSSGIVNSERPVPKSLRGESATQWPLTPAPCSGLHTLSLSVTSSCVGADRRVPSLKVARRMAIPMKCQSPEGEHGPPRKRRNAEHRNSHRRAGSHRTCAQILQIVRRPITPDRFGQRLLHARRTSTRLINGWVPPLRSRSSPSAPSAEFEAKRHADMVACGNSIWLPLLGRPLPRLGVRV